MPLREGLELATQPNPFGPRVTLAFELPARDRAEIRILDVSGRLVRVLPPRVLGTGRHTLSWDGQDDGGHAAPSGIYFAHLRAGGLTAVRKMTLIR
jgi:hypothetical protein